MNGWPVSTASNPLPSVGSPSRRTASASFHSVSFTNPPPMPSYPQPHFSAPLPSAATTLSFASSAFPNTYPQYLSNPVPQTKPPQQTTAASTAPQSPSNAATLIPILHTLDSHRQFPHLLNYASVPTAYLSASLQQQGVPTQGQSGSQSKTQQQASATKQVPKTAPQPNSNNNQNLGLFSFGAQPLLSYGSVGTPVLGQTGGYQFFNPPPPQRNGVQFGQAMLPQATPMKPIINNNNYASIFGGQGSWPFLNTAGSQILGSSAQQPLLYYPGQQYGTGNYFGFPNSGGFFPQNPFLQPAENIEQQYNTQGDSPQESNSQDSGVQKNEESIVKKPAQVNENPESPSNYDDSSSSKSPSKSNLYDSDDKYSNSDTDHHKTRGYSNNYKPSSSSDDSSGYTESSGGKYSDDDDEDESESSSSPSKSSNSHYSEDDDEGEDTKQTGYYKKPQGKPNQYSNDGAYYKSYSTSYVKPPKSYKTSYSKPYSNHRYEDEDTKPSNYHRTSTSYKVRKPYSSGQYRGDDDQYGSPDTSDDCKSHCQYHGGEGQRTKPLGSETFDDLQFQFSKSFDNLREDALPSSSENSNRNSQRHGKKPHHGYPRQHRESSNNQHTKTLHRYPYRAPKYSAEVPTSYFKRQDEEDEEDADGHSSELSPVRTDRHNNKSYNWSYHQQEVVEMDPERSQR